MGKNFHLEARVCPHCTIKPKEYEIITSAELVSEIIPKIQRKISNMFKDAYYHISGVYHFHEGY